MGNALPPACLINMVKNLKKKTNKQIAVTMLTYM